MSTPESALSLMIIANSATRRRIARRTFISFAVAVVAAAGDARALSELVIRDSFTGVAIGGYDPVAYFIDGEPRLGDPSIEVEWSGAYFAFVNQGNAAAFRDAPQVFTPAYGGYGVLGVSREQPQEGDPRLFVVRNNRLFFFHSPADRKAFLADPDTLIALADSRWPAVRALLSP